MVVMSRGGVQNNRGENPASMHASKRAEQKIEEGEQLLPGIPDDITIDRIAPKLPWTTFHILSSVSRSWQRAIQSHQVYDARVRSGSTQTLVALSDMDLEDPRASTIALFSREDGSWYHLPPIPGVSHGIPCECEWTWLDGKLYVLGGLQEPSSELGRWTRRAEVYMWDLAGQQQWKQCASMEVGRILFGCAAKDGKIYVFAGQSDSEPIVCGSEVYDPKKDAWSPFTPIPMGSLRSDHQATMVGEEFFLYGGKCTDFFTSQKAITVAKEYFLRVGEVHDIGLHLRLPVNTHPGLFAEVYHPEKDQWRIVKHFSTHKGLVLMVGGKLHKLNEDGITLYDSDANTWKFLQRISFGVSEASEFCIVEVFGAVGLDDEILAIVEWSTIDEEDEEDEEAEEGIRRTCLISSRGVGAKNTEIVWEVLECPIILYAEFRTCMCSIQL